MNREGKRCLLYSRVSTEIQVDGYSLDAQKNGLKRFAEREEMTVVDIYEDAGKSGKSIEGRPAFKKLLSDVEVHIYPEGESKSPLKSIKFNFPVLQDGKEVEEIFLNKQSNVETLITLRRKEG